MAASTPPLAVPSSLVTNQAAQAKSVVKSLDLGNGVLAGVAINHQQHLMRGRGRAFWMTRRIFFQFFHQVQLRGQAAGGVD